MTGKVKLPMSDRFPLPAVMFCTGCGDKYCSESCRAEAWRMHHSLLCSKLNSEEGQKKRRRLALSPQEGVDYTKLREFYELAAATNEIFILASRVLVMTSLRADELLASKEGQAASSSSSSSPLPPLSHPYQAVANLLSRGQLSVSSAAEALQCAWLPFQAGWKKQWHESVACPPDVEDEATFRAELRELATNGSSLLRKALPGLSLKYPALFSDDVFSSVIGLFELNNLSLSPPCPVEDFFLEIDGSNDEAAKASTKPYLDALDKTYDKRVEGTGFFALQSFMNHDCGPKVVPEWTVAAGGSAVASMTCLKEVGPGDELTISYIEEGLDNEERSEKLKDYGFTCTCALCVANTVK
jgi:hypothetical protein